MDSTQDTVRAMEPEKRSVVHISDSEVDKEMAASGSQEGTEQVELSQDSSDARLPGPTNLGPELSSAGENEERRAASPSGTGTSPVNSRSHLAMSPAQQKYLAWWKVLPIYLAAKAWMVKLHLFQVFLTISISGAWKLLAKVALMLSKLQAP